MTDVTADHADEEILVLELSDEFIEAAAGADARHVYAKFLLRLATIDFGCPG